MDSTIKVVSSGSLRTDLDTDGKIIKYDDGLCKMTGYAPEQFDDGSVTFRSLIPSEDLDTYMEKVSQVMSNGMATLGHRIKCADGHMIQVICTGKECTGDDGHKCVDITLTNISETIRTAAEIEALTQSVPGGVVVYKIEGGKPIVVKANDEYYRITGLTKDTDGSLDKVVTSFDLQALLEKVTRCVENGESFEGELKIRNYSNKHERKWIRIKCSYFDKSSDGCDLFYCSMIDITARHETQRRFDKQNMCFRIMSEAAEQVFFEYDVKEDELLLSDSYLLDNGGEQVINDFIAHNKAESFVHTEDMGLNSVMWNKALRIHDSGSEDLRLKINTEDYRWYRIRYENTPDEHGRIESVYGVIQGIDNEKQMSSKISRDRKEIERLSSTDSITLLYNRSAFIPIATKMLKEVYNEKECFAIVYSDINDFSYVNENFGYEAGNKMLYDFAEVIRNCGICVVGCRIYSDYFASLYKACDRETLIKEIGVRNRTFTDMQKKKYPASEIQISYGICFVHSDDTDIASAIDNANLARRSVKGSSDVPGGIYTERMREKHRHDQKIASEIWGAIKTESIELFLQPKFDMQTRDIIGAEALSRWRNPDGSYKMPFEFIEVLENIGYITHLDFYIYEKVLQYMAKWKREGRRELPISINFSRKHNNNPDFVDRINALAEKYGIEKSLIEVEVTEGCFTRDVRNLFANMKRLRDHGFKVDIDDFGTGYSSLSVLMNAPVDIVKIDKAFIDNIVTSELSRDYINHICNLVSSTKKEIIFEGVESEQQAEILLGCGYTMAQGWLFDKAIRVDEFEKKYL